jgi:hypothetical protein
MKVTRRELVALAVAATAAVAQDSPEDQNKRTAETLEKFELAQDIEPAFAFKA